LQFVEEWRRNAVNVPPEEQEMVDASPRYDLEPYTLSRQGSQNSTTSVSFEIDVDGRRDGPEGVPQYQWDLMRSYSRGRHKDMDKGKVRWPTSCH
jgi:hypothetical protein